jgi:hypothetical protein
MSVNKDIMVLGDVHGEFGRVSSLVNSCGNTPPKILLQCGDFGYFPRIDVERKKHKVKYPKLKEAKLYFCDGNHENHWSLKELTNNEIFPNVFYMKRGSTLTLPDGRVVLFMGGAYSIDKKLRTMGYDWFPEEVISQKDVESIHGNMKVDIVISHTCPFAFDVPESPNFGDKINDPSRHALSLILRVCKPSLWYFGHWHFYRTGYTNGCRWTALNMAGRSNWWQYLEV